MDRDDIIEIIGSILGWCSLLVIVFMLFVIGG